MTDEAFDVDPFPGEPRILFIGHAHSTHTHSWIDLLTGSKFNIRLFGVPTGYPPPSWKIRTYVTVQQLPENIDTKIHHCFHPTPQERIGYRAEIEQHQKALEHLFQKLKKKPVYRLGRLAVRVLNRVNSILGIPRFYQEPLGTQAFSEELIKECSLLGEIPPVIPPQPKAASVEAWLARVIQEWRPDIIHTLGLDHDQGGFFYHGVRKTFGLEKHGKWVLQLRGGSDLTLNRHDPEMAVRIAEVLKECDRIICDNTQNIVYAEELGVPRDKFAEIVPIPGTGGIDVEAFSRAWDTAPSRRERIVLWPKAYNCPWSVALPVFEALKIVWDRIKPCTIHMLAMSPDAHMWYNALPENIRHHCAVRDRIPRQEVLSLMQQSRVLLAPSLVDGIPNTLYEAMAAGAFPIVSPLETISSVVENERNVLFARNLYPDEIAESLERSMTDDVLVDTAAHRNFAIVRRFADRAVTAPRVVAFYRALAA